MGDWFYMNKYFCFPVKLYKKNSICFINHGVESQWVFGAAFLFDLSERKNIFFNIQQVDFVTSLVFVTRSFSLFVRKPGPHKPRSQNQGSKFCDTNKAVTKKPRPFKFNFCEYKCLIRLLNEHNRNW